MTTEVDGMIKYIYTMTKAIQDRFRNRDQLNPTFDDRADIDVWRTRATRRLADLSGRTLPRLIAAPADWPVLSAPMAEALTGASGAAVQRNFDIMAEAGIIRELTGQGRFRMWAAKV